MTPPGITGQNSSFNSMGPSGASKPQSTPQVSSASPSQSAKDYDFSSLTQGMFSKPWAVVQVHDKAYDKMLFMKEKK